MWLFLSKRIRTWVLFSVAVPIAGAAVHAAAKRAQASDPTSKTSRALTRADTGIHKISRRKAKQSQRQT